MCNHNVIKNHKTIKSTNTTPLIIMAHQTGYRFQSMDVSLTYCRAEMYAGCVTCCPLVSHVEYALRAPLRLERRRDRQTEGQTPDH